MVRLILVLLLFLPLTSRAECVRWLLCEYTADAENIYIKLPAGSQWQEIEIADPVNNTNRAIVCSLSSLRTVQIEDAGCVQITRNDIPALMVAPYERYDDGGVIRYRDGGGGRPLTRMPFEDRGILRKMESAGDSAFSRGVPRS